MPQLDCRPTTPRSPEPGADGDSPGRCKPALRSRPLLLLWLAGLLGAAAPAHGAQGPDPQQILWQRDLEDALELARSEGRRLLVVANADGESASERIVRERYRDPEFVAWTRRFVCVVGSVFRHTPRDVSFDGRRIACPRLGAVTCGEHIALEPLLFERFFADTEVVLDGEVVERISPRHVVSTADGDKAFDLFLLFDLRELDRALEAAAAAEPPPGPEAGGPLIPTGSRARLRIVLREAVRERAAAGRALVERMAREQLTPAAPLADAILHAGDAGHAHALFLMTPGVGAAGDVSSRGGVGLERIVFIARVIGAATELSALLQGQLQARGVGLPLEPGSRMPDADGTLRALEGLDGEGTRTLRLSLEALPSEALARVLAAVAADPAPPPPQPVDDRPSAAEYEAQLETLDPSYRMAPDDPELQRDFGRALLGLARRRIEAGDGSAGLLLEDAAAALDRAAEAFPTDYELQLQRARCAFYRSDFEVQEQAALAALGLARTDVDRRTEAQRWLGDAGARLIVQRASADESTERGGIERTGRALMAVATGPEADATDWVSFASFMGATGRPGEQCAVALQGLATFPDSDALRAVYASGARWVGAPKHLAGSYEELAALNPGSGTSAWYAGWSLVNLAEWQRRGERPRDALATYARAEPYFRRALELRPDYAETSEHYLGMCALGRGFAHLIADQRSEAADALVDAIAVRPALRSERDGLEREAIDLVDGALEWRRTGPSPVDGIDLAERLIRIDPSTGHWAGAVADALLREGLRAVGRGEPGRGVEGLRAAHAVARRALALEDDPTARRALAQAATCLAEVLLAEGLETAEPGPLLTEAAGLLELEPPPAGAAAATLEEVAARLRAELGPARPVARPGR